MRAIFIIIFFSVVFITNSQIPEIYWQNCYNTSDNDEPKGIVKTDNGYLIAVKVYNAVTIPNFHGLYEIVVISTDTSGTVLWEKAFGGTNSDYPAKIIKTNDNNFLVFGKTNSVNGDIQSGNNGGLDIWLVKINLQGEILWERTYGSTGNDEPGDLILTPDNGFLFSADIEQGGGDVQSYFGGTDIWLCKCNEQGGILWEKTFGNTGNDESKGISLSGEETVLLAGSVEENGGMVSCTPKGNGDYWVVETDMQGNIISDNCYGGTAYDAAIKAIKTSDGFVIFGTSFSDDGDVTGHHGQYSNADIWVVKTDNNGEIIWEKALGGSKNENPAFLSLTVDSGIVIIGNTFSEDGDVSGNHNVTSANISSDIWSVKLSSSGLIEWQRCFGGYDDEVVAPYCVSTNHLYDYTVASSTNSSNSFEVECTESGNNSWVVSFKRCPDYNPATPGLPSGPDTVYSKDHPVSTYTIDAPANGWTFNWKLEPDTACNLISYGLYAEVEWEPDFTGTATISAQSANYCGVSNWSEPKTVQVYNTIGVEEIPLNDGLLKVYPNPAKDFVIFETSNTYIKGTVRLVNVFGEEVASKEMVSEKTVINLREINRGVYFYRVKIENNSYNGEIVILQ